MTTVRQKLNAVTTEQIYEKQIIEVSVLPYLYNHPGKEKKIHIKLDAVWMSIIAVDENKELFHERYEDIDDAIAEAKALRTLFEKLECEITEAEYPNEYFVTFKNP